jgi:excisionase family DNA binding protein
MAIESSALPGAQHPWMDTDPDRRVRDIVIDTMADAGYPPRSSANSRAYRKRERELAAPVAQVPATPPVLDDEVECYTTKEVCEKLKIKDGLCRQLILGGSIKSFALYPGSEDRRVRKRDLAEWITSRLEGN